MIYAIQSPQGLVRISAGWPSVATSSWDATNWKTVGGAQRALHRALDEVTVAVGETQRSAAACSALDLLTGACVVAFDADSHARHAATLALRGRVDARRRTLIAGLAAVVDAALLVGPGATIDGTAWTPAMCDARIEREVLHVLDQCALDTEVGEGWADEGTLRAWVAARRGCERWR